jgi:DNA-binding MarR family transcriptional regulator
LARQNVQRLADVLQEVAFVAYIPNPEHQQAKLVSLTDKGKRAIRQLTRHQALWSHHIVSNTGAGETQEAFKPCEELRSRLETNGKK